MKKIILGLVFSVSVVFGGGGATLPKLIVDYHMDECSWDSNDSTYEIKNFGTLGDDANASAKHDANVTEGKINHGGDMIGAHHIVPKKTIHLENTYTVMAWIKFLLSDKNHKTYYWYDSYGYTQHQYYNIADRSGYLSSFIFFDRYKSYSSWHWRVCVDDNNGDPHCSDEIQMPSDGWHLVSFVNDGSKTTLYIDKEKKSDIDYSLQNIDLNRIFSSDYEGDGEYTSIGAKTDEFKIFSSALSPDDISIIYDHESSGENYNGDSRDEPHCGDGDGEGENKTTLFNAVNHIKNDTCNATDDWENNITTQIVNNSFDLWVLSKDEQTQSISVESNITKVEIKYYSDGNTTDCYNDKYLSSKILCDDTTSSVCNDTNASGCVLLSNINISKAVKCVQIYIEGRNKHNTSQENNSSYSKDDFAIRPKAYKIETNTTTYYAGVPFHIDINATNPVDNNTTDYNETNGTSFSFDINVTDPCIKGELANIPNPFKFGDGNISFDTNYSEVGDVNFTVHEINGSEFAKVDEDDTNDNVRLIKADTLSITVNPYQFAIVNYQFKRNNPNEDWRYMAGVNDSNMSISFNIEAQNQQNETTKNFTHGCAATNVGVKIDLDVTNDDANASYYQLINNSATKGHDKNLSDINFTGTVNDSNFTDGNSTIIKYALNVYRVYNSPKEPRTIAVQEVNTTDANVKNIGLAPENNSSKFFYARLYTQDLSTSKTEDNTTAKVLVYDTSHDDYVNGLQEELSHWWYYTPQSNEAEGNITALNVSNNTKKKSADDGMSATSSFNNNGSFTIKVKNPNKNTQTHYIHLDVSPWIWYVYAGFGSDYNDSDGSSCSEHPCIKYNYHKEDDSGIGVKSGSTTGVAFDVNVSKNSKGIRLLR